MPSWILQSQSKSEGRTYARNLGIDELGFYYDACFHNTADAYYHHAIETKGLHGDAIFHYDNVVKAWTFLKRIFPLFGARFEGPFGTDDVKFVVSERQLAGVKPGEITFDTLPSAQDVDQFIKETRRGPTRNFYDTLNRLFIIRQTDTPHRWHVIFTFCHCTNDGTACASASCKFFDLLTLQHTPRSARLGRKARDGDLPG